MRNFRKLYIELFLRLSNSHEEIKEAKRFLSDDSKNEKKAMASLDRAIDLYEEKSTDYESLYEIALDPLQMIPLKLTEPCIPDIEPVTSCERIILECLWLADQYICLRELIDMCSYRFKREWKRQTVNTFLTHLIEKKYVDSYREGRVFFYKAVISKETYLRFETNQIITYQYNDSPIEFLSALSSGRGLSEDDVTLMERLIHHVRNRNKTH